MVYTQAEVLQIVVQHRTELAAFGVVRLGLFGSFARNEQTEESDIDFLAEYQVGAKNLRNITHPAYLLQEWLGRTVDYLTKIPENPYFKESLAHGIIYVEIAPAAIAAH